MKTMYSRSGVAQRMACPPPARRLVVLAASAGRTRLSSGNPMVQLNSSRNFNTHVVAQPGGNLADYMRASPAFFSELANLPQGGRLVPIDLDRGLFDLTVPRISIFDMWIQPRATAIVRVEELHNGGVRLAITADECKLQGSEHVEKFKLNDKFELDVGISFTSHQTHLGAPGSIQTDGSIKIKVEVPPPFRLIPSAILTSTANTALSATLSLLLSGVSTNMAHDYTSWVVRQLDSQRMSSADGLATATLSLSDEDAGVQHSSGAAKAEDAFISMWSD